MLNLILDVGFELFHLICVITLASYFIIRTSVFNRVVQGAGSWRDKILITLFFGGLSIYGTMSNIWLNGSPANVRDLGPVIAGLVFGPELGIGVAIIGAVFRYSLGGVTVVPCTLTTLLAGILAGLVWVLNRKKFIGTVYAVLFIIGIEILHLILILLLAGSGTEVQAILGTMWTTMLPLYVMGIAIFSIVYTNFMQEQVDREELVRKQVELKSAFEIQNSFLPDAHPVITGYDVFAYTHPAREVGGDFFDYISLDDGKTALVIADVSGKSVPAAIFMALSCTMVRVSARWVSSPKEAAIKINRLITRYAESGMFFSMVYATVNQDDGNICYVNAGHPPPVVFRCDGREEELLRTGPIIGFLEDQLYEQGSLMLEGGDLLVGYTDGVTEARRSDGEMFGKERLYATVKEVQTLSAEEISTRIIEAVISFSGDMPQFDDISLLIVKRKENF